MLPVTCAVVFAGTVTELTVVRPGELSTTVTGVSFVVTLTVIGPERLVVNENQSVSLVQTFAWTLWPPTMIVAVCGVSFGSNASVHGGAGAPAAASVETKTYVCGEFTGTLVPLMTAL